MWPYLSNKERSTPKARASGNAFHCQTNARKFACSDQVERVGSDSSKQCEYIISEVDQRELPLVFQAACEVACMEMNCRRPPHDIRSVLLHDWGVQVSFYS